LVLKGHNNIRVQAEAYCNLIKKFMVVYM